MSDRELRFGDGVIRLDADGAVSAVVHPDGVRPFLLTADAHDVEAAMHDPTRRWGKGFVITDRGGRRWDHPAERQDTATGVRLLHRLEELELVVERSVTDVWTETYEWTNVAAEPVSIGSLAVSTPWRDVYAGARDCLRRAVHAHVWAGGAGAWVWVVPMDGSGPGLGLTVTEGVIAAYSVESRDQFTSSNVRGHLNLHVTDHHRSPHAMGGQEPVLLAPGETYRLRWELDWFDDLTAFRRDSVDPVDVSTEVGGSLDVPGYGPVRLDEPGVRHLHRDVGSRVSVFAHPPLRALVEARIRFALDRQRPVEQPGSLAHCFVPYDTESGLRTLAGSWRDWSNARERVGTALLLQEARARGWGEQTELDEALAGYSRFVAEHVQSADGTIADDVFHPGRPRLYNFPWFARFHLGQDDLDRAIAVMDRYYALGGEHFLAFELGAVLREIADRCRDERPDVADRMLDHLVRHARRFLDYDEDLPAHEVNYEQSMVAPLVDLLCHARAVSADTVPAAQLLRRLGWLTAFAADQPDVRLRHVPIRHWDGYWFGRLRLWGDVFPHYWSVLSAGVFLDWPADTVDPGRLDDLHRAGRDILRANLTGFGADGSATCAFVYPSCVDGRPAHVADPLANDQDWALVYAVRYADRLGESA